MQYILCLVKSCCSQGRGENFLQRCVACLSCNYFCHHWANRVIMANLQHWCATYRVSMIQPVTRCIIAAFKSSREYQNYWGSPLHWSNKVMSMIVMVWIFEDRWVIAVWQYVWPTITVKFVIAWWSVCRALLHVSVSLKLTLSCHTFLNWRIWNRACRSNPHSLHF